MFMNIKAKCVAVVYAMGTDLNKLELRSVVNTINWLQKRRIASSPTIYVATTRVTIKHSTA